MTALLLDTVSGRVRPSLAPQPLTSSLGKPWNGFFVREQGATDMEVDKVMLLKHMVCLQLQSAARLDWWSGGETVNKSILPGQICIFPANKLHSGHFRHAGRYIALAIDPDFVAAAQETPLRPDQIDLRWEFGVDSPVLRELLLLLHEEARQTTPGNAHYATAIARLIAIHLVQRYGTVTDAPMRRGGLGPRRLSLVNELIQSKLGGEITLDELARTAGLSVFHFSRVFRQTTGESPFQYVTRCRIQRAKQLLLDPFARISDVALRCGFCDQAHFTRQFKRAEGMTPAVYVRSQGCRGGLN